MPNAFLCVCKVVTFRLTMSHILPWKERWKTEDMFPLTRRIGSTCCCFWVGSSWFCMVLTCSYKWVHMASAPMAAKAAKGQQSTASMASKKLQEKACSDNHGKIDMLFEWYWHISNYFELFWHILTYLNCFGLHSDFHLLYFIVFQCISIYFNVFLYIYIYLFIFHIWVTCFCFWVGSSLFFNILYKWVHMASTPMAAKAAKGQRSPASVASKELKEEACSDNNGKIDMPFEWFWMVLTYFIIFQHILAVFLRYLNFIEFQLLYFSVCHCISHCFHMFSDTSLSLFYIFKINHMLNGFNVWGPAISFGGSKSLWFGVKNTFFHGDWFGMVATISGSPSSWVASQRVLGFQIYPPWSQTLAPWGMAFAAMLHACAAYVWLHWVHPGNQTYLGISFLKNCVVFNVSKPQFSSQFNSQFGPQNRLGQGAKRRVFDTCGSWEIFVGNPWQRACLSFSGFACCPGARPLNLLFWDQGPNWNKTFVFWFATFQIFFEKFRKKFWESLWNFEKCCNGWLCSGTMAISARHGCQNDGAAVRHMACIPVCSSRPWTCPSTSRSSHSCHWGHPGAIRRAADSWSWRMAGDWLAVRSRGSESPSFVFCMPRFRAWIVALSRFWLSMPRFRAWIVALSRFWLSALDWNMHFAISIEIASKKKWGGKAHHLCFLYFFMFPWLTHVDATLFQTIPYNSIQFQISRVALDIQRVYVLHCFAMFCIVLHSACLILLLCYFMLFHVFSRYIFQLFSIIFIYMFHIVPLFSNIFQHFPSFSIIFQFLALRDWFVLRRPPKSVRSHQPKQRTRPAPSAFLSPRF